MVRNITKPIGCFLGGKSDIAYNQVGKLSMKDGSFGLNQVQ
jgi:hypothetical protein